MKYIDGRNYRIVRAPEKEGEIENRMSVRVVIFPPMRCVCASGFTTLLKLIDTRSIRSLETMISHQLSSKLDQ